MGEKYLIDNRLHFIQQVHHLMNFGYTNYFIGTYPIKKKQRFLEIDKKLISKYNMNLSKDRKYYRKKKDLCNYVFLRSREFYIILKTTGKDDIEVDDNFVSIFEKPLSIPVSDRLLLTIFRDGRKKITVKIEKESFREIRENLRFKLDNRRFNETSEKFNNLNGLPGFSGIVKQKIELKKYLLNHFKKNTLGNKEIYSRFDDSLRINTKRKVYKIEYS